MLFLTSELANEDEITILSARDTTRAWVPGRGIMGTNVGYIRTVITRGFHLGFRSEPTAFFSFLFVYLFLCLVLSFSGTMHLIRYDRLF